ncbi:hypothetical protein MPK66_gp319 [Erwinia phage pEa_SNUABM_2]|uniref:Uncharacterized protein n=1 Tax=Erwinia phage pEa_SNUABM_2 TaxID=2869547 RepID=A0AAE8C4N7_9CAUD|nr:hypothetical protein MPK66_gp319 [Erwinia phage pEa_SNUABM_2]QZE59563.1 hypothetical protein pEaSNUABM2_00319 [Erwinia phage pEa_SNUABM_2]QZE59900.1 hypothetical protein pEaSNUABM39_00320 [Erwinia phage pEa_SNUABM_39]
MINSEVILTGVFAQLYSRLVMAAIQRVHVYYSDLAPVIFGVQFTRMGKAQYKALEALVVETMRVDIKNGRPPIAAIYVSRANDTKKPTQSFFDEYERLTGKRLTDDEWLVLVEQVWKQYAPDLREPS